MPNRADQVFGGGTAAPPAERPPSAKPPVDRRSLVFASEPAKAGPPEQTAKPSDNGSPLFRSASSLFGGPSMSEAYKNSDLRKALEGAIPESIRKSSAGDYTARFMNAMYQTAPEAVDFMTSPFGIGLFAAHVVPQTRGLAAVVDFGMGVWGTKDALDAAKAFKDDQSPESAARLAASLAFAYMGTKAGQKTAEAHARRVGLDPIKEPKLDRDAILEAGDDKIAMLREGASGAEVTAAKKAKLADQIQEMDEVADRVDPPYRPWAKPFEIPREIAVKKLSQLAYSKPVVRDMASIVNIPKNDLLAVGADLVSDRAALMTTQKFDVQRMLDTIKAAVPEEELKIYDELPDGSMVPSNKLAGVLQGTVTPEQAGLSQAGRDAIKVIQQRTRERDAMLTDLYGADYHLLDPDTYLTQIWDFGDNKSPSGRVAKTLMRDRFSHNQRVIDDYAQGIDISNRRFTEDPTAPRMKPKYNNIVEILNAREQHAITAVANGRMARTLRDMGAMLTENEVQELGVEWAPLKEAPSLYHATYSGTDAYKAAAAERSNASRKQFMPTQTITYKPVYVHPAIEQAVGAIFEKPFEGPFAHNLTAVTSFSKKNVLSFSLFHNGALSEVTHAVQFGGHGLNAVERAEWLKAPGAAPRKSVTGKLRQMATGTFFMNPEYLRGLRDTLYEINGKKPKDGGPVTVRLAHDQIRPWLDAGLDILTPDKVTSGFADKLRKVGLDGNPVTRFATLPFRLYAHTLHALDKPLWEYYFPSQMLNAAETMMVSEMSRLGPNASPARVKYTRQKVAENVNNLYGAVAWEKLLVSPKTRQAMSWVMLAPAWRVSQLRVLTQNFEGTTASRLSGRYIASGALAWFFTAQAFNYALSAMYGNPDKNGETGGHFTWDNPGPTIHVFGVDTGVSSNVGNIAAGFGRDRRESYLQLNKAMRDTLGYLTLPHEELLSGLHPIWKTAYAFAYGRDIKSGYELVNPNYSTVEKSAQRLDILLGALSPYSADEWMRAVEHEAMPEVFSKSSNAGGLIPWVPSTIFPGVPTSAGMTYTEAGDAFTAAMTNGDTQAAAYILKMADLNHMSRASIVRKYAETIRSRARNAQGPATTYDRFGNAEKK